MCNLDLKFFTFGSYIKKFQNFKFSFADVNDCPNPEDKKRLDTFSVTAVACNGTEIVSSVPKPLLNALFENCTSVAISDVINVSCNSSDFFGSIKDGGYNYTLLRIEHLPTNKPFPRSSSIFNPSVIRTKGRAEKSNDKYKQKKAFRDID